MKDLVEHLLKAPDSQLDAAMRPLIEKWSDPPSALQVLEVLDKCVEDSLASGFVVRVLHAVYDIRCTEEGTTHAEVEARAEWRKSSG